MIVCIAEKPSVARDIAQVLGAVERHEGYLACLRTQDPFALRVR